MDSLAQVDLALFEQMLQQRKESLLKQLEDGHLAHPMISESGAIYTYTAGLTRSLGYELIVVGLDSKSATHLLTVVGNHLQNQHVDDRVGINGIASRTVMLLTHAIRDASGTRSMAPALPLIYGVDLAPMQIRQICWPDAGGKFPWDAGFDQSYQPAPLVLMGSRLTKLN